MISAKSLEKYGQSLESYLVTHPESAESVDEFKDHLGHTGVTLESDAHGQFSTEDFDFDQDCFVYTP